MPCDVQKFKLSDWDEIDAREELVESLKDLKKDYIWSEMYTNGMPIFTYRADGKIIMIYGMFFCGCGTYMPAVLASRYLKQHLKSVVRLLREYYATYVPLNVRRLEAYCDLTDPKALSLAKHFGFSIVGIRHNASPEGHDQAIMERLVMVDKRKVGKEYDCAR